MEPRLEPQTRTPADWKIAPVGPPMPPSTELAGWGRHPRIEAPEFRPVGAASLATALSGRHLPRGLGRSYGDASLPAPGHAAVNGTARDHFLAFDPKTGILEAESGVTLERILRCFLPKGWFLPVTPGTCQVTLGGAVASNVHGKNHHRSGSIEKFIESIDLITPTGPANCSPNFRNQLFLATVGGYGLTGFITKVRLRLKPVRSSRVVCLRRRSKDLDGLFRLFEKEDAGWEYSVAWLDSLARGRSLGRGILMLGNHEEPSQGNSGKTETLPLRYETGLSLPVPSSLPASILSPSLLGAFNAAFYLFSRSGGPRPEGFAHFFYPLDRLRDWNLLYGKPGFLQYQCCIPDPGEEGVAACLELLSAGKVGAFLSVLKRCGDDQVLLPFCRKGYTLALDIPFRGEETLKVLGRLDELVIRHKGRVYLTKDARLSKEAFRAMYPEWDYFMFTVRRANPDGRSSSRMAERLGLWEE
jgi:decaprenylphospho-beta-D-ribofuranose 2-oxidase